MKKKEYLVITFAETMMALYMEKVCKEDGKEGRIIPLPREIDAGCGLAWATEKKEREEWENYLIDRQIIFEKMVEVMI
ncbi:MAG: DUF3343 domain-containing protein [Lachnospiraceae bacterium]|nr:DUF3343 domain-containing protein [Robinsoniella sp.]MDY3766480.1 DUF3343 domain-containing protein [Lachnospiraceae bacterium]